MTARRPTTFDDLEKLMLEGFKDALRFGLRPKWYRKEEPHWTAGLTNKERIESAKIRFAAMKEVAGYLKAKYKPKEAGEEDGDFDLDTLVAQADEAALKERKAQVDAKLGLEKQAQRGPVTWQNSTGKKNSDS